MSSMDTLDVGQANELKLACRREGFTPEDLKWLCSGDTLSQLRKVRAGRAHIAVVAHAIDCDADPFIPHGWRVEEHQKGGQFTWNASKVSLYLDWALKGSHYIKGEKLRETLKGRPVLNANVLDYLLANPHLIPEEWKGKYVFFWGTVYRDSDGDLYVRYLDWRGGRWRWSSRWLDFDFDSGNPAALRAS